MPTFAYLALRYVLWLIGLRIIYGVAVMYLALPDSLGTTVILASVPAVDIGIQAARRLHPPITLGIWGWVWGLLVGVYLVLNVLVPAIFVPAFRGALMDAAAGRNIAIVIAAVAFMVMLFLWIGARVGGRAAR